MPRPIHILLTAALACCAFMPAWAPAEAAAQDSHDSRGYYDPAAPQQSFLDRKVGTSLQRFSKFQARIKKEHFTAYLCAYSTTLAVIAGLIFGAVGYRLSDPMSPYRSVKRRTVLLASAIGAALGIFGALTQVPPAAGDKITLLVLSVGCGAAGAFLGALLSFLIMRWRSNRAAVRDGRPMTKRMRHA